MAPIVPILGIAAIAALALASSGGSSSSAAPGGAKPATNPNNPYDQNLTPAELAAVQTALSTETDPAKLDALAKAMLPDHPLASAALSARANLLRLHGGGGGVAPPPPMPLPAPPPPPPPVAPAVVISPVGTPAIVSTTDTGTLGNLNVRSTPDSTISTNILGQYAHGARVTITGPNVNGFFPTSGTGVNGAALAGFASAQYLPAVSATGQPVPAAALPATVVPASAPIAIPVQTATVTTQQTGAAGALYVRDQPNGTVIGAFAHGATVVITGPQSAGFYPVSGTNTNTGAPIAGWASAQYLTPNALTPAIVSAGFVPALLTGNELARARVRAPRGAVGYDDVSAGPQLPFSELNDAALALKIALDTNGCRSYNEPLVKRFQAAAKASGLYAGDLDGWYGVDTQAALAKLVGRPAPACFPEAKGGPINPQEYWSPIGA